MADHALRSIDALTEINLVDMLDGAGLVRFQCRPLRRLLQPAAQRFARKAHEFDERVGRHGLARASAWLVGEMSGGMQARGLEHVPMQGPLFILANHPGMTDTVALFASLAARPDLKVIAQDRPFLRALPNVARQLIFLPEQGSGRMAVIRAGARHLNDGGALLTFPAGRIEPDLVVEGPLRVADSLREWSDSYTLFSRLAPATRFVPALVSHVVSPAAQRHPLTMLRRAARDKARLAATLQIASPRYRDLVARVSFGAAVAGSDAGPDARPDADHRSLREAIEARMRELILAHQTALR